ncbi:hypothetical protein ACFQV2_14950 [Actinokineospora soli]|uniref:Uncharacterized protein n=1 Tax=Actinokineospora soli TaxID=1048753 RepID=A0ABW2TN52_9PSEU
MRNGIDRPRFPARGRGVFNSAVAAAAIGAAWEVGALDHLDQHGKLDIDQFADDHDLDADATRAMFQALAAAGIVERSDVHVLTGPHFTETLRARSLFHWLVQGSGALFAAMPRVLRRANRTGRFYERDAAAIGYACREINARFFDPVFWSVMSGLDFPSPASPTWAAAAANACWRSSGRTPAPPASASTSPPRSWNSPRPN